MHEAHQGVLIGDTFGRDTGRTDAQDEDTLFAFQTKHPVPLTSVQEACAVNASQPIPLVEDPAQQR